MTGLGEIHIVHNIWPFIRVIGNVWPSPMLTSSYAPMPFLPNPNENTFFQRSIRALINYEVKIHFLVVEQDTRFSCQRSHLTLIAEDSNSGRRHPRFSINIDEIKGRSTQFSEYGTFTFNSHRFPLTVIKYTSPRRSASRFRQYQRGYVIHVIKLHSNCDCLIMCHGINHIVPIKIGYGFSMFEFHSMNEFSPDFIASSDGQLLHQPELTA